MPWLCYTQKMSKSKKLWTFLNGYNEFQRKKAVTKFLRFVTAPLLSNAYKKDILGCLVCGFELVQQENLLWKETNEEMKTGLRPNEDAAAAAN